MKDLESYKRQLKSFDSLIHISQFYPIPMHYSCHHELHLADFQANFYTLEKMKYITDYFHKDGVTSLMVSISRPSYDTLPISGSINFVTDKYDRVSAKSGSHFP